VSCPTSVHVPVPVSMSAVFRDEVSTGELREEDQWELIAVEAY